MLLFFIILTHLSFFASGAERSPLSREQFLEPKACFRTPEESIPKRSELELTIEEFKVLQKEAQCYEGRKLTKEERPLLSSDYLEQILNNPNQDVTIATLTSTFQIFVRIILRERHADIDYIVEKLKKLSTLADDQKVILIKAEKERDLTILEELLKATRAPAFRAAASPSKSCLKKDSLFPEQLFSDHDSGHDHDKEEKRKVTFADLFDDDQASDEKSYPGCTIDTLEELSKDL